MTNSILTAVGSPCIAICKMDSHSGLCEGCHRTIDEIADWAALDDSEKLHVLTLVEQRKR